MSYSRWSNSVWYTYWSSSSDETRDGQIFEICDMVHPFSFTYKELKEDIHACIQKVKEESNKEKTVGLLDDIVTNEDGTKEFIYKDTLCGPRLYSTLELDELRGYMEEFIRDIEEEYK